MTRLVLTEEEKQTLKSAVAANKLALRSLDKTWSATVLEDLKYKIKDHCLNRINLKCCYCLRVIEHRFRSEFDTEHVLPKSIWPQYTFRIKNLSISCKRCNTSIKGNNLDFLTIENLNVKNPFVKKYYKILHPNIDSDSNGDYKRKLELVEARFGDLIYVKYLPFNKKAQFTYEYFKLIEFEKEKITEAQGALVIKLIESSFNPSLVIEIKKILKDL